MLRRPLFRSCSSPLSLSGEGGRGGEVLLLTLLAACARERPPPPPRPHTPAPLAVLDAGPETLVSEAPAALPVVPLRWLSREAPERALSAGSPLPLPGAYVGSLEDPPRWLVARGRHGVTALDARSGRALGGIDSAWPSDVLRRRALLPGWQGEGAARVPAVLDLATGSVRVPRARTPEGAAATVERLLFHEEAERMLVTGRGPDGALRWAPWDPAGEEPVTLAAASLVDARSAQWNHAARAFELYDSDLARLSQRPPGECARARLSLEGQQRCVLTALEARGSQSTPLGGDWVAEAAGLRNALTGERREASPAQGRLGLTILGALQDPPRAVYAWTEPGGQRHLELLAPQGSLGRWSYTVPAGDANSYTTTAGETTRPLVAERGWRSASQQSSGFFVDLERGAVLTVDPPVDTLTRSTLERRALAVLRGDARDTLVLLDFDARTATRLGPMPRCPGPYWPSLVTERVLGAECSVQPNPQLFRFERQWSTLWLLARGERYRSPHEALELLSDGRLVLAAGRLRNAESESPQGGLRVVTLR